jgi:cold shock CspA family protein
MTSPGRVRGVVQFRSAHGFIRPSDTLMNDRSRVLRFDQDAAGSFTEGDTVSFEFGADQDGQRRAVRVRRVS